MTGIIYAIDDHDRDQDEPWPVPASHWFWSHDHYWNAVVAKDWWKPGRNLVPINETPSRSGIMVYRDASGMLHHKEFVTTSEPPAAEVLN